MTKKSPALRKKIWSYLQETQFVYFATCDRGQPRVRPVTLIHLDEDFYVATGSGDAKVGQIGENPKIEFCLMLQEGDYWGYVRGIGAAGISRDNKQKTLIHEKIPFLRQFWETPDDPAYTLLKIDLKEIEFLKPGEFKTKKFSV